MILKLEIFLETDSDTSIEEIKKVEHYADYLLDLDNYPEIKSVFGVKVKKIED